MHYASFFWGLSLTLPPPPPSLPPHLRFQSAILYYSFLSPPLLFHLLSLLQFLSLSPISFKISPLTNSLPHSRIPTSPLPPPSFRTPFLPLVCFLVPLHSPILLSLSYLFFPLFLPHFPSTVLPVSHQFSALPLILLLISVCPACLLYDHIYVSLPPPNIAPPLSLFKIQTLKSKFDLKIWIIKLILVKSFCLLLITSINQDRGK